MDWGIFGWGFVRVGRVWGLGLVVEVFRSGLGGFFGDFKIEFLIVVCYSNID